jgi:type III secretion system YscQ/HrcQ family protein
VVGRGAARLLVPDAILTAAQPPRIARALWRRRGRLDAIRAEATLALAVARIEPRALGQLRARDVLAFPIAAPKRDEPFSVTIRVAHAVAEAALDGDRLVVGEAFRFQSGATPMSPETPGADDTGADQLLRELPVEIVCEIGRVTMSGRELIELVPGAVIPLARPLSGPIDLTVAGRLVARGELVDVEGDLGVRISEVVE